jgi:hypothetical protein
MSLLKAYLASQRSNTDYASAPTHYSFLAVGVLNFTVVAAELRSAYS